MPQGNLAERIRAAGAGIGVFLCPTGYGTELAKGKETREIAGRHFVLKYPIHGGLALIKAETGDRWGNLTYRKTGRNFCPVMATAARITVTVPESSSLASSNPNASCRPGFTSARLCGSNVSPRVHIRLAGDKTWFTWVKRWDVAATLKPDGVSIRGFPASA